MEAKGVNLTISQNQEANDHENWHQVPNPDGTLSPLNYETTSIGLTSHTICQEPCRSKMLDRYLGYGWYGKHCLTGSTVNCLSKLPNKVRSNAVPHSASRHYSSSHSDLK